eukprot:TRINITY_DN8786_c0_g1_i1.p1 TRINITY_DN8786_c0_g1~~TRINITY_DN8786_c0_g1_i1.p1  ORF type:complete len:259 (+),score=83.91 TRINITY_DN8786_c0_g1_i1:75-851(+)
MSTKVFVGNLSFATTDQDLQDAFADIGKVKRGTIITRGGRPLGYGFVEFSSAEEAAAAIEKKNNSKIHDRDIRVESAVDPSVKRERSENTERATPPPRARRGGRGGRRTVSNRTRKTPNTNNTTNTNSKPVKEENSKTQEKKPRRPRATKPRVPPEERVLSKTTLYVANLPFKMEDSEFHQIFDGTNFVKAYIARNPRSQRSKGFGFVEFSSEEDQLKAKEAKNGYTVDTTDGKQRKLTVNISYVNPAPQEEGQVASS